MFGQDNIIGQKTIKIDDKGRIILPDFTHVESKDTLLLGIYHNGGYLKLFSKNQVVNVINSMIETQKNVKEEKYYKFISEQINSFQSLFLSECVVDNKKRITIPSEVRKFLNFEDNIYICGGTDLYIPCLNVYSSKEDMVKRFSKTKHYGNS